MLLYYVLKKINAGSNRYTSLFVLKKTKKENFLKKEKGAATDPPHSVFLIPPSLSLFSHSLSHPTLFLCRSSLALSLSLCRSSLFPSLIMPSWLSVSLSSITLSHPALLLSPLSPCSLSLSLHGEGRLKLELRCGLT